MGHNLLKAFPSILLHALALTACFGASVKASPSDRRLEDFIELNRFASPYASAKVPDQWCYYKKSDRTYNWWYFSSGKSESLTPVEVRGAFGVPITIAQYGHVPMIGALVVGYVIDGGRLAELEPVSFSSNPPSCALGIQILVNGPFPVVSLAKDLAKQTVVDPAPEYRIWAMEGGHRRVRFVSAIPVEFSIDGSPIAGRIVLGFTGRW